MDTKTLHDWAIEANLDVTDPSAYPDAIDVWLTAMFEDGTWLNDILLDWMSDGLENVKNEDGKTIANPLWVEIGKDISRVKRNRESLERFGKLGGTRYLGNSSLSLATSLGHLGETIYRIIFEQAEKYIETHAEEWWMDVGSYAYDMEAGAREDWEYENYKDRMLDRRLDNE